MYKILQREMIIPNMHILTVEAPHVARKVKAGQFIILRPDERGERIPLSVADWDRKTGAVTSVFLEVGTTTSKLARLNAGETIPTYAGPLGKPTEIDSYGTVICAGGCYGIGAIYPIIRALKEAGNRVIALIEAHSDFLLYWEDRLRQAADQVYVTTTDGTKGEKGLSDVPLRRLILSGERVDRVITIGCTFIMQMNSEITRPYGIPTKVALNPIMIDGTGMCGGCRCAVGGETKFACVDGPEFDGHAVDWKVLVNRRRAYTDDEITTMRLREGCYGQTET
jgi:ferredoxin--NADP+ reductase